MEQRRFAKRVSGDQRLALAVIRQAVEDARNPSIDLMTKLEAAEFLGGPRSEVWCRLAGLDPRTFQRTNGGYERQRAS